MPLYEYQCENCGEVFELIQKFSAEPLEIHEKCGGKVHRLISAPALQFKGSGWYITDYAKSGSAAPGNGGKKDGDSGSGGKETGTASGESGSGKESSKDSGAGGSSQDSSKSSPAPAAAASSASSDKK